MIKHIDILITGNLKEAAFAFLTIKAAHKLNINGYVGYTSEYNILIEAESNESQLNKFIEWCNKEKYGAEIKDIIIKSGDLRNYDTFEMNVNAALLQTESK